MKKYECSKMTKYDLMMVLSKRYYDYAKLKCDIDKIEDLLDDEEKFVAQKLAKIMIMSEMEEEKNDK